MAHLIYRVEICALLNQVHNKENTPSLKRYMQRIVHVDQIALFIHICAFFQQPLRKLIVLILNRVVQRRALILVVKLDIFRMEKETRGEYAFEIVSLDPSFEFQTFELEDSGFFLFLHFGFGFLLIRKHSIFGNQHRIQLLSLLLQSSYKEPFPKCFHNFPLLLFVRLKIRTRKGLYISCI